jgi:nitrite reductase/ring-hydroxylating ferredoxin subunit
VSALRSRLEDGAPPGPGGSGVSWTTVDGLGGLAPGHTGAFSAAGMPVVGIRLGDDLFAYRDRCPVCGGGLAGGAVERRLGGRTGDAVLRCPTCSAHFDVRRAGRGLDGVDEHLEPLPLLVSDGVVTVAVPGTVVSA